MNSFFFKMMIAVCLMALPSAAFSQLPQLDASTMKGFRIAIEPTEQEVSYLKIDWQPRLDQAVAQAHEEEKPLLIYVMNGHPLGCT